MRATKQEKQVPVAVIVLSAEDIEQWRGTVGTIIGPAVREGREIYASEET
jgi:hypothetical protein